MSERRGSPSVPTFTRQQICNLHSAIDNNDDNAKNKTIVALIYVHASWTSFPSPQHPLNHTVLKSLLHSDSSDDVIGLVGSFSLDHCEDTMAFAVGDDEYTDQDVLPIPPAQLPALALSVQEPSGSHARVRYLTNISPYELMRYIRYHNNPQSAEKRSDWSKLIHKTLHQILQSPPPPPTPPPANIVTNGKKRVLPKEQGPEEEALRIFIAGDRSSVGKSSVCLGLLGNFINQLGYKPSELAYIKPATQCEARQLVQDYCESVGIDCRAVGPLVYYKGFTRAFLDGKTPTSPELLNDCGQAVDEIARGKKIVLVDGVGFPAVGSICGTDNAQVSKACGYPDGKARRPMGVVLVGGSGVGAAVDSFNLNATYFEQARVPVLGGIFNKLSTEGYYSLENCRTQLTNYFRQNEHQRSHGRIPFGFVPLYEGLSGDNALSASKGYIQVFGEHVNIQALLDSAKKIQQKTSTTTRLEISTTAMDIDSPSTSDKSSPPPRKRLRSTPIMSTKLSRKDIEQLAASQGAATA